MSPEGLAVKLWGGKVSDWKVTNPKLAYEEGLERGRVEGAITELERRLIELNKHLRYYQNVMNYSSNPNNITDPIKKECIDLINIQIKEIEVRLKELRGEKK